MCSFCSPHDGDFHARLVNISAMLCATFITGPCQNSNNMWRCAMRLYFSGIFYIPRRLFLPRIFSLPEIIKLFKLVINLSSLPFDGDGSIFHIRQDLLASVPSYVRVLISINAFFSLNLIPIHFAKRVTFVKLQNNIYCTINECVCAYFFNLATFQQVLRNVFATPLFQYYHLINMIFFYLADENIHTSIIFFRYL